MEEATLVRGNEMAATPWLDEKQRRTWLRESDDLQGMIEDCRMANLDNLPSSVYDRIHLFQSKLGTAHLTPPREVGLAHEHMFELQRKLMHGNPKRTGRLEDANLEKERGFRVNVRQRKEPEGYTSLQLPEDIDLVEHPDRVHIVNALVERVRDIWIQCRYDYYQAPYTGGDMSEAEQKDKACERNYLELRSQRDRLVSEMSSLLVSPSPTQATRVRYALARTWRPRGKRPTHATTQVTAA